MALKRWGRSASGVEMGKKEQLLPPLKQWEGMERSRGQTAGGMPAARSRGRDEQAALPAVARRRSGAPRGRRSLPRQVLPGRPGAVSPFPATPGAFPPPVPPRGPWQSRCQRCRGSLPALAPALALPRGLGCAPARSAGRALPRPGPGAEQRRDPR